MLTARADVVRSLLPPPELLEAEAACRREKQGTPDLEAIEALVIDRARRLEDEAEAGVFTDGEMHPLSGRSGSRAVVRGFAAGELDAFLLETRLRGVVPRAVGA